MTAAPGPQQPDEVTLEAHELRPGDVIVAVWDDVYDGETRLSVRRDRPAAPSAQPDGAAGMCAVIGSHSPHPVCRRCGWSALLAMADATGVRYTALFDLWAHLTTVRAGGPLCAPGAGVVAVRLAVDLGWRPMFGQDPLP